MGAKEENVKPDGKRGITEQHFIRAADLVTTMAVRYSCLDVRSTGRCIGGLPI